MTGFFDHAYNVSVMRLRIMVQVGVDFLDKLLCLRD
jgi:hypothetical protein